MYKKEIWENLAVTKFKLILIFIRLSKHHSLKIFCIIGTKCFTEFVNLQINFIGSTIENFYIASFFNIKTVSGFKFNCVK